MDVVLDVADDLLLDDVWKSLSTHTIPRDDPYRQMASLYVLTIAGAFLLYITTAGANYLFLFDHEIMKHKRFLKNQVRLEITAALLHMPLIAVLTTPIFWAEVRGYSMLYDDVEEYGFPYLVFSMLAFLMFVDFGIYWIHRGLHIPIVYKYIHKLHHKWLVPTPFASHAFNWLDGFSQSSPYHIFVFIVPLHKITYLGLFVFVNVWTVSIHDGIDMLPEWLQEYVNGSSHHTDHHLYFNYNYGQFFTLWDRVGGSHRNPTLTKTKLMDKDLNVKDTPVAEQDELKSVFKDDANFLAACSPQDLNVKDTPVAEQDVFKDDAHLLSDAAAHKKEE